jgi:FMN phosphatase YigB (HAD superfamily)
MIKAIIFDADGSLYQRGSQVAELKTAISSVALTSIAIPKDTQGDYNLNSLADLQALLQRL